MATRTEGNTRPLKVAILLLCVALLGAIFLIATEDDPNPREPVERTTTTEAPTTTTTLPFGVSLEISDDDELLLAALDALRDVEPAEEEWHVGVLIDDSNNALRVLARNGPENLSLVVLTPSQEVYTAEITGLVGAGDIVSWDPAGSGGEDNLISPGEIVVLEIAAVYVEPTPPPTPTTEG